MIDALKKRLDLLELKIDRVLEALGVGLDEDEEFQMVMDQAARTLDFTVIQDYCRRKLQKERSNGDKDKKEIFKISEKN